MTATFKVGDRVRRLPTAPRTGAPQTGTVTRTLLDEQPPIILIRYGWGGVYAANARHYLSETHAHAITAHVEHLRRVGAERVAKLARLWGGGVLIMLFMVNGIGLASTAVPKAIATPITFDQRDFPCAEDEVLGFSPRFGPDHVGCIHIDELKSQG